MKKTICIILALAAVVGFAVPVLMGRSQETAAVVELEETTPPLAEEPAAGVLSAPADDTYIPSDDEFEFNFVNADESDEYDAAVIEQYAPEAAAEPAEEEPAEEEPAEEPAEEPEAQDEADAVSLDTAAAEAEPQTTVKLDAAGGTFPYEANNLKGSATVTLVDGKLPDSIDDNYKPTRSGYRFLGWFKDQGVTDPTADPFTKGEAVEGAETLYAGWIGTVTLDAEPGSFIGQKQNYTRTVDLVNGAMPSDTPKPLYDHTKTAEAQSVEFLGWYTKPCKVTATKSEDGSHQTWNIVLNGELVQPGKPLEPGTTLFAGYNIKEDRVAKKTIEFYLDYNGINGMWGKCLTLTRSYDSIKGGYALTFEDLAVQSLNWIGSDTLFHDWDSLQKYWNTTEFNGYTFKGWATTSDATEPDIVPGHVVKNGGSIYAVWTKGDSNNTNFQKVDPNVGPLETLRVDGALTQRTHPGNSLKVQLFATPTKPQFKDIVWTITTTDSKGNQVSFTDDRSSYINAYDLKVSANNKTLSLTVSYDNPASTRYGADREVTVTAYGVLDDGTQIPCTGSAATLSFVHSWDEGVKKGQEDCIHSATITYTCQEPGCGQTKEEKVYALNHTYTHLDDSKYYEVIKAPTCTQPGVKQFKCTRCGAVNGQTASIPATGHSWEDWKTTKEPTTGSTGEQTRECSVCHTKETEVLPKLTPSPAPAAPAPAPGNSVPAAPSGGSAPSAPAAPSGGGAAPAPSGGGAAPAPEKTPEPTATPKPTATPEPTAEPTPEPTATPKPTAEPKATAKPAETVTLANGLEQAANGKIYMKDENGENITGQQKADDGKLYYFSASDGHMLKGGMVTGTGGKKYLASSTGALLTGQQKSGGKLYYFSAVDGHMLKGGLVSGTGGKKFLASSNGVLKTGLQVVNGKQYYFSAKDGHMMKNGWVNGGNGVSYKLDSNGVVIATR